MADYNLPGEEGKKQRPRKWYNSLFAQLVGIGIVAPGLIIAFNYEDMVKSGQVEQTKQMVIQAETQRLKTVEEMTRQYGSELSPEELTDLLEENNLNQLYLP